MKIWVWMHFCLLCFLLPFPFACCNGPNYSSSYLFTGYNKYKSFIHAGLHWYGTNLLIMQYWWKSKVNTTCMQSPSSHILYFILNGNLLKTSTLRLHISYFLLRFEAPCPGDIVKDYVILRARIASSRLHNDSAHYLRNPLCLPQQW
jgi:hypothetical protein